MTLTLPASFRDRLRALVRDRSGLAMVEFAVSLPILLTMGLCGFEVANYGTATMRVSELAMLTADNAARVRDKIDEVDVNELMTGAKLIGAPIDFGEHGRIILSSVEQNAGKTGQWIRWQRCTGKLNKSSSYGAEDKGKSDALLQYMGPANNQIAALPGTAVMFVEVFYEYQPLVGDGIIGKKSIHYLSAFNVRQRNDQVLSDDKGLKDTNKNSSCAIFAA